MNRFDERYEIRRADIEDTAVIIEFIRREWATDHIYVKAPDFFLYEFADEKKLNYIIAIEKSSGIMAGMIGYIPASKNAEKKDIWGVMWKISEKMHPIPFLGIELMKRMIKITQCRTEIGIGANILTSIPLLKMMLGFHIGKMRHFYLLADQVKFKLCKIKEKKQGLLLTGYQTTMTEVTNWEELKGLCNIERIANEMIPYKDSWYVKKRYFDYPFYKYHVYCLSENREIKAVLVTRMIEYEGASVIRIVDYIGEQRLFSGLGIEFSKLLESGKEYIDMYCLGFDETYIFSAGFVERTDTDKNIIPNYFEPYEDRNIDIWVNSNRKNVLFFKADGDQDRPNKKMDD